MFFSILTLRNLCLFVFLFIFFSYLVIYVLYCSTFSYLPFSPVLLLLPHLRFTLISNSLYYSSLLSPCLILPFILFNYLLFPSHRSSFLFHFTFTNIKLYIVETRKTPALVFQSLKRAIYRAIWGRQGRRRPAGEGWKME